MSALYQPIHHRNSALAHLDPAQPDAGASVALLRTQHRMHPAIREVVSRYHYAGRLDDAPRLSARRRFDTKLLREAPRAMWYVLDEDGAALPDIRAERGPGGRSWVRRHSVGLVDRPLGTELGSGPGRMRPVLTREQERLCAYTKDGKPRLVRGVAGSGKTVILASWLAQTAAQLARDRQARIWVIYGNRALGSMLWDCAEQAWREQGHPTPFPRERIDVRHVRDVLADLHTREGLRPEGEPFDYEAQARRFADRVSELEPLCDALFIDEAQDLGHETLRLFFRLVRRCNAIVFFDNAQNTYRRTRPAWSELGLDIRGRATVLKESYRSTRPICEFALNVLYRLAPPSGDEDHQELCARGLLVATTREGRTYWQVRFNDVEGPIPQLTHCRTRSEEVSRIAERVASLIRDDAVSPRDIRVLHVGKNVGDMLVRALAAALTPLGVAVVLETSQTFTEDAATVVVTSRPARRAATVAARCARWEADRRRVPRWSRRARRWCRFDRPRAG